MEKKIKMKNQKLKLKKNLFYQLLKMDMEKKHHTLITELQIGGAKVLLGLSIHQEMVIFLHLSL